MKVSVYNFKSIKELKSFEIKPLTIIAGVNNSGKSSLFQILLLIKQTMRSASTAEPLISEGEFFSTSRLENLVFNRKAENKIGISFEIKIREFSDSKIFGNFGISPDDTETICIIDVKYSFFDSQIKISEFHLLLDAPVGKKPYLRIFFEGGYKIVTNVNHFGEGLWLGFEEAQSMEDVLFEAILPIHFQLIKDSDESEVTTSDVKVFTLPPFKAFLTSFFSRVSYLGPVRAKPRSSYFIDRSHTGVGVSGEYSAQILKEKAKEVIFYHKIKDHDKQIQFELVQESFLSAVRYWMCDRFGIGNDIYAVENDGVYQIFIKNQLNMKTTINHVGFGVSQLLPIVIEGLGMPDSGVLLLEEPESHLHPKLQATLFDFLYSLTLKGKIIMMETHSDHFITRMRRRTAEDTDDKLANNINLTFTKMVDGTTAYEPLEIDQFGVVEYFPEDFIELADNELSAIIEAQIAKGAATQKK